MALNRSGDLLPEIQYGGALTYDPNDGQILTKDERNGVRTTEGDEGTYYVRVEERQWYNTFIVFPNEPSGTEVKVAVLKGIEKLKPRGLDVIVYIYTGNKSNKITWRQIKAPNDNFMEVEYVATSGEISPNWSWD